MASSIEQILAVQARLKRGAVTCDELAHAVGVDKRTAFRYLDLLKKIEPNLKRIREAGREVYWCIDTAPPAGKQLAASLKAMEKELANGGNHKYRGLIQSTIQALLPPGGSQGDPAPIRIDPAFHLDHGPLAEFGGEESAQLVSRFLGAIHNQSELEITYHHGSSNSDETFVFHPAHVVLRVGRLYLLGYKTGKRTSLQILSLQRIKRFRSTGKIANQKNIDPSKVYEFCFGAFLPEEGQAPESVVFEIKDAWVKALLQESNFKPQALFSTGPKGETLVELKLHITPDFENWMQGLLPSVKILAPASLRTKLRNRLKKAMDAGI